MPKPEPRLSAQCLVAHRGYPARFPENSLPGVDAALEAGARWIEVDVQLTRDRVPVACHDDDLRRIAGRPERIASLTWQQLAGVDIGEADRFGAEFAGTRPVRLTTVAERISQRDAVLFLDIKAGPVERLGAAGVLKDLGPALTALGERAIVISTRREMLEQARAGGLKIGWILPAVEAASCQAARRLAPDYLFCNVRRLADQTPWPGPWQWAVYVVDEAARAREWLDRGISLVETDRIGTLLEEVP